MMNAIIYLHTNLNLMHRDIKPENILLFKHSIIGGTILDRFYDSVAREHNVDFKLCGRAFFLLFMDRFRL